MLNANHDKPKQHIKINRETLTNMVKAQQLALQIKVSPRCKQESGEYTDQLHLLSKKRSVLSGVLKSPSSSGSSQSNKRSVSFKDEDDIIPTFSENDPYKEMKATRRRYHLPTMKKDH